MHKPNSPTLLLDTNNSGELVFSLLNEVHVIIITVGVLLIKYKPSEFLFTDTAVEKLKDHHVTIENGQWTQVIPVIPVIPAKRLPIISGVADFLRS